MVWHLSPDSQGYYVQNRLRVARAEEGLQIEGYYKKSRQEGNSLLDSLQGPEFNPQNHKYKQQGQTDLRSSHHNNIGGVVKF